MVLIKKKIKGKRCDVILIPRMVINRFISKHIDKEKGAGTCLVTSKNDWTGRPEPNYVIKPLLETFEKRVLSQGEDIPFPIPHHLFQNLKCRKFDDRGMFVGNVFEGDLKITLIKIEGRTKSAIKQIRDFENINIVERIKIKGTLKKIDKLMDEKICEKEYIWLVRHIHPAR